MVFLSFRSSFSRSFCSFLSWCSGCGWSFRNPRSVLQWPPLTEKRRAPAVQLWAGIIKKLSENNAYRSFLFHCNAIPLFSGQIRESSSVFEKRLLYSLTDNVSYMTSFFSETISASFGRICSACFRHSASSSLSVELVWGISVRCSFHSLFSCLFGRSSRFLHKSCQSAFS